MIEHTKSILEQARDDVFILIGKCMLNLQLYERQLKNLLPYFELSSDGPSIQQQKDKLSKMMMGSLVGMLVEKAYESETKPDKPVTANTPSFTSRFSIGTDQAEVERIRNDLADLVSRRNFLIHHFRNEFDLTSEDNCLEAKAYLESLDDKVKLSVQEIKEMAERMDTVRRLLGEFLASPEGQKTLDHMLAPRET